jgi:hypothetical protein
MPKVSPSTTRTPGSATRQQVKHSTKKGASSSPSFYKWWDAKSQKDLAQQLVSTGGFLREQQQYRYRQTGIYSRLYGNMPLFNFVGSGINKQSLANNLPVDRPTMNVVQSCVDTLVSRITQSRPRPIFLTDNGDYKERRLAKQLNNFVAGELYSSDAYALGELILRDAAVLGSGCIKVVEKNGKVALERVLLTELLVDPNETMLAGPRQMYQFMLVDRSVVAAENPEVSQGIIDRAEQAFPDTGGDAARSVSDQIILVEGWHLPSGPGAKDGRHTIACSSGIILDESWEKEEFPFVFLHFSPRIMGFWGQGLSEQLMGTQIEINKLMMTISASINLVGVPRVFVEDGSRIVKAHLNNAIGSIVTYRGTAPNYVVAPCVAPEIYARLESLIGYAYQQSGISTLSASSQKPAGLTSGEALREYDDLQSDRFAALAKRYDNMFVELAYHIIDEAKEICERDGSYKTVYPSKNGTKEIDLPAASMLNDTYVIQCYDASSLPRDPAGRLQKVTEMMQTGMITPQEARRLLDFPDLEQVEKLANASEERIFQYLDQIVEEGKFNSPDPFMDLNLALTLCNQYYNMYVPCKLEQAKIDKLEQFAQEVQALVQAATPPPPPAGPQASPMAPANPSGAR